MGFSRGRSGGLVFRSLEDIPEFVVVHIVKGFGIVNKAAAAAAKSLQLCPTLCDPIDSSPPGSSAPRIL